MKLPSVPGPADLVAAVAGLREGVSDALALVPRVGAVVGRLESLLTRVEVAVGRVEGVLQRVDLVIDEVEDTRARATAVVAQVEQTDARAATTVEAARRTVVQAAATVAAAESLTARAGALVDDYEPVLLTLAPTARRLAATVDPDEVAAVIALIDRLPALVDHLDADVFPILESMGNVGDDLRALVAAAGDVRQVVSGFPGSGLFRRRGAEEETGHEETGEPTATEPAG